MRKYIIKPTDQVPELSERVEGTPWSRADSAEIDIYPWYERGDKQATTFRLLYDSAAIYLQFQCQDKHIDAERRQLNGPVCLDSCVEFFAMFDPSGSREYFNFEANCCGEIHLGLGTERHGRKLITPDLARRIRICTSVDAPSKHASPDDAGWWLAAELPLDMLSELAGRPITPAAGDRWLANFYRCGGTIDPQYACWSDIDWPEPDFHRPEFFSEIHFA